jgi:hypothetical protein
MVFNALWYGYFINPDGENSLGYLKFLELFEYSLSTILLLFAGYFMLNEVK